jgi:hypothetical protein
VGCGEKQQVEVIFLYVLHNVVVKVNNFIKLQVWSLLIVYKCMCWY